MRVSITTCDICKCQLDTVSFEKSLMLADNDQEFLRKLYLYLHETRRYSDICITCLKTIEAVVKETTAKLLNSKREEPNL